MSKFKILMMAFTNYQETKAALLIGMEVLESAKLKWDGKPKDIDVDVKVQWREVAADRGLNK